MKRLQLITAFAATAVLTAASVSVAQPIDSFLTGPNPAAGQYALGQLAGQNASIAGWSGAWQQGFGGTAPQVIATGLTYPSLPVAGGAIDITASGRAGRQLSNPADGSTNRTLYLSFLMQAVGTVAGGDITFAAFETHNNDLGDGSRQFEIAVGENIDGAVQNPNYTVSLFNSDVGPAGFAADLGPNNGDVNLFVARFDFSDVANADVVTLYRNPEDLSSETNSTPDFTATGFDMELDFTTFARFGAPGTVQFDELRMGATYESVTSPVDPFTPGDTDGDFVVELEDFFPIRDNWLETNATFGMSLTRADGDLNLNGMVSIEDFREWKNAFNGPPSVIAAAFASLGASPVPEPSSLMLTALVGLGLAAGWRKSRK